MGSKYWECMARECPAISRTSLWAPAKTQRTEWKNKWKKKYDFKKKVREVWNTGFWSQPDCCPLRLTKL